MEFYVTPKRYRDQAEGYPRTIFVGILVLMMCAMFGDIVMIAKMLPLLLLPIIVCFMMDRHKQQMYSRRVRIGERIEVLDQRGKCLRTLEFSDIAYCEIRYADVQMLVGRGARSRRSTG